MLDQYRQNNDPLRLLQIQQAQLQLDQARNPQPDPGTADMREYEFARLQGYTGTFQEWKADQISAGATNVTTTINGDQTTPPDEEELRRKLAGREGEAWSGYLDTGAVSAGTIQDLNMLDEIITMAPQGPVVGRLAEMFPGVNSAAAAFDSIVKRVAPTLRAPGSGSTSDIEYADMLRALPQLSARPEANRAISAMMRAKAQLNLERAQIVRDYQNNSITARQAREAMAELDGRSIMTPELQQILSMLEPVSSPAPDGVDQSVWDVMTPEEKALFQ
jgi:hypothetical protein